MPRKTEGRTVGGEANLAERVRVERERKGWSYERLAEQMKAAGCPTQSAAMFRIEKGDPPRRITVDELIAFARVFGTTEADLLKPVELIRKELAQDAVEALSQADERLAEAVLAEAHAWSTWQRLADEDDELSEFASNLHETRGDWRGVKERVLDEMDNLLPLGLTDTSRWQVQRALEDLMIAVSDSVERGTTPPEEGVPGADDLSKLIKFMIGRLRGELKRID